MENRKIGEYFLNDLSGDREILIRALDIQSNLREKGVDKRIGQIVVEGGWLDPNALERALKEQREDILSSVKLFETLSDESLLEIVQVSRNITFPAGTAIFNQFDQGDAFYVIINGHVRVYRVSEDGVEVTLTTLGPGDGFGEIALLTGEPRSASVAALDTTNLILVPKDAFDQIMASNPELFKSFMKIMADWLTRGNTELLQASATERAYQRFVSKQMGHFEPSLVGRSAVIKQLRAKIDELAQNDKPVLIMGEEGTAMWDVGGLLHQQSSRSDSPLLRMDSKNVFLGTDVMDSRESDPFRIELAQCGTLFGQKKGALPFAPNSQLGLLQMVGHGTVVIENVDHLTEGIQEKLADFILDGRFQTIGDQEFLHSSARIIVTCSSDLKGTVESGRFDARLYGLLSEQTLTVPPLRKRKRDISQLVDHFIERYNRQTGKNIQGIDDDAYKGIMAYDWPGNTEELEVVIRRAVHLARGDQLAAEDIFIGQPPVTGKITFNLLKLSRIRQLFHSEAFPLSLRIVSAFFIGTIIYLGLFGIQSPQRNIALVLTWGWWEPLVVLSTVFAARMWCGICPVGALSSFISRVVGLKRKVPSSIKKYGFYFGAVGIGIIFWAESASRMVNSPRATAYLILTITFLAVIAGILYQRRAWCRYLCPLGGMVGVLSSCSAVELRSNYVICTNECKNHECYVGRGDREGCPMFEAPFSLHSNQNCIMCGDCIKLCPSNSPVLNLRLPGYELWNIRKLESAVVFLGLILLGTQLFRGMEKAGYFHQFEVGWSYWWAVSMLFLVGITILAFMYIKAGGAWAFRGLHDLDERKTSLFMYALIPLVAAFEISYQSDRLLSQAGFVIPVLGRQIGFAWDSFGGRVEPSSIKLFQVSILLSGTVASLAVLKRLIRSRHGEASQRVVAKWRLPIMLLAIIFFWITLAA